MAQARKAGSAAWGWTWYHSDHLQSATVLSDKDGNVVRRLAYKPFGEEVVNSGTGEKPPYTYTGKELDASGLMYYGARYYDPALARFITPDTVDDQGTQGFNRYSYALNNPIRYNDPSGHESYDSRFHVERTNTLLDLQVRLGGTGGLGLHELGQDERAAVLAALGGNGKRQDAVDMLEAMRLALGLPTPAGRIHALTSDDIGGLLRWQAARHAGHPVLSQWEEVALQQDTGEQFFAGSVLSAFILRNQLTTSLGERPGTSLSFSDRVEANAARRLSELEASSAPGAHFFSRHGAQTTLEQQYIRATTGLTPDGIQKYPVNAGRFLSHRIELSALQRANTIYQQQGTPVFSFSMEGIIGEGFTRDGMSFVRTTNVQAVYRNGKLLTLYPNLSPLP